MRAHRQEVAGGRGAPQEESGTRAFNREIDGFGNVKGESGIDFQLNGSPCDCPRANRPGHHRLALCHRGNVMIGSKDELMLALDYYLFLRGVLRIAEPRRLMSGFARVYGPTLTNDDNQQEGGQRCQQGAADPDLAKGKRGCR